MRNPFRYFNSSPEVIRLVVMMYIRYPLSLRQVEDLLFERGIDICHETVLSLSTPRMSGFRRTR
jgi:putative transposase